VCALEASNNMVMARIPPIIMNWFLSSIGILLHLDHRSLPEVSIFFQKPERTPDRKMADRKMADRKIADRKWRLLFSVRHFSVWHFSVRHSSVWRLL
jgi:hypothetical protein